MSDYRLVPCLQEATLEDYIVMFDAAYGRDDKLTVDYLRWEYCDNPDGKVIVFDAFKGSELAAHYAIIPRTYQRGSDKYRAALSVNTATDPRHQGKGLFTLLANATYQAAADQGVQFVVGVANANSNPGFTKKLGFTELGKVCLYASLVGSPFHDDDKLSLHMSSEWLKWRLSNPSRHYSVWSHGDGSSSILTKVRGPVFNIARVKTNRLPQNVDAGCTVVKGAFRPALIPCYGESPSYALKLPERMQPSPWHMIWKTLSSDFDASIAKHLVFDGISMDTF